MADLRPSAPRSKVRCGPRKRPKRDVSLQASGCQAHLIETINKLVRVTRRLLLDLGREPTLEEIVERLAMPVEKVRRRLEIANRPIVLG